METLAQKAARGAGHAWGIADDVGRSARWFAAHGLAWAAPLLALLDDPPPPDRCPFRLGAFLADSSGTPGTHRLTRVTYPAWLLPPLAQATSARGRTALVTLGATAVALLPHEPPRAAAPWPPLMNLAAARVEACLSPATLPALDHPLDPAPHRPTLSDALARRLAVHAARTTVPSSDHSRAAGAGGTEEED